MNIKQLQHNLNYKHHYTGTPSIQANNFTPIIEVKTMKQTLLNGDSIYSTSI